MFHNSFFQKMKERKEQNTTEQTKLVNGAFSLYSTPAGGVLRHRGRYGPVWTHMGPYGIDFPPGASSTITTTLI